MKKIIKIVLEDFCHFLEGVGTTIAIIWALGWFLTIGGTVVVLGAYIETHSTIFRVLAIIFCAGGWCVLFYYGFISMRDYFKKLIERSKSKATE
jgi:hypothetical protein